MEPRRKKTMGLEGRGVPTEGAVARGMMKEMKCIMCNKKIDPDKDAYAEVSVTSFKEMPSMNQMTPENTRLDMENGKAYGLQCVTCHGIWIQLIGKHMEERRLDKWMEGRKWEK